MAEWTPGRPVSDIPAVGLRALEPSGSLVVAAMPVQALVPHPPRALTLVDQGSSARPGALEGAYAMLDRLRADLQGADGRVATGRLGLILGWL